MYAQLVFGQMCMQAAHREFGCPAITFDEVDAQPRTCRRALASWLRGAGNDEPDAGLRLVGQGAPESDGAVSKAPAV